MKGETKLSGWGNYPEITTHYREYFGDVNHANLYEFNQEADIAFRGNGRSYGDQAVIDYGQTLSSLHHNRILAFDTEKGELIAESGLLLADLLKVTLPKLWIPAVCPGTQLITLGGAIANDVHGKSHHFDGSFQNIVAWFTLLTPNGNHLKCSPEENTAIFYANFGGMGLLGFIATVCIKLQKIETPFFAQKSLVLNNIEEMVFALAANESAFSHSVAWINTSKRGKNLGSGVLTLGNYATKEQLNNSQQNAIIAKHKFKLGLPFFLPDFTLNNISQTVLNSVLHYTQKRAKSISSYHTFLFPLDAINHWNRAYGKQGFTQLQFVIPMESAAKNLSQILTYIYASGCVPFLNVLKKMGKRGDEASFLSFPEEGYTLALDFKINRKYFEMVASLNALLTAMNGKIYLGKDVSLAPHYFKKMYPNFELFLALKKDLDPENKLQNSLSRRIGLVK